jgi:uncharacterized phage-like protein YoqJ
MTPENNKKAVCFTGHRHIPRQDALLIPGILKRILEELIQKGVCIFKAGGAIGFDTIAALCVLELKEKYPDISLELILPCREQTKLWNEDGKLVYDHILSNAERVEYVSDSYTSWCMHERNRRLVEGSDYCIAYLTHSGGGTAYTYAYALQQGLEVINLNEYK